MDRRGFLKTSLVVGAAALSSNKTNAQDKRDPEEFVGILVDTTRCIGCRACEVACGEEHDLLVPDVLNDGALEKHRKTSVEQWTIVNKTVYALLPGCLCYRLPHGGDVKNRGWTGYLERKQVYRLPLLHGFLPV